MNASGGDVVSIMPFNYLIAMPLCYLDNLLEKSSHNYNVAIWKLVFMHLEC